MQNPFFRPAETPGPGRSGSDPPPEGGCPRCPHEFSCSRTSQHKGGRPQVSRCPRSNPPPRLRYNAARYEVPRDANPQTRPARTTPGTAAGPRKWLHHSPGTLVPQPHSPRGMLPSSNPVLGGLSGLARWARTPPSWQDPGGVVNGVAVPPVVSRGAHVVYNLQGIMT